MSHNQQNQTIVNFKDVSFSFSHSKKILDEVNFSMRAGMKVALMGQNGAGKSTLFQLIATELRPESGVISINTALTVATAHQIIKPADRELSVFDYFKRVCADEDHQLKSKISSVLAAVNLITTLEKTVNSLSGGQQARLLLAAALIQNPDLLLLDEPTNNLDHAGIAHLTQFLIEYKKSCLVISHDADFLNAFTKGVLYLDAHTKKIEQYAGDYYDVVAEITARIEKENRQNARMAKEIQENKDKANFFAHKGGKMRLVAKKMREKVEKYESEKVEVRKEDKPIRSFQIPAQQDIPLFSLAINSFTVLENHQPITKTADLLLTKKYHLQITGPNGIGKTTLIESIAKGTHPGSPIPPEVRVGYYRQDFSTLNFDDTVHQSLTSAMIAADGTGTEEQLRSVAAGFLMTKELMNTEVGKLSEGQKGLLSFARLVLQKPGLLILDEPTNHINFRHLPIIAAALDEYQGAMIIVSHVPEFLWQIRIDAILDLEK